MKIGKLFKKLSHSKWTLLAPIALTIVSTFSPAEVRAICLIIAVCMCVWIFNDTELAKGSPEAKVQVSKRQRIGRTSLATVAFLTVAILLFFGINRAERLLAGGTPSAVNPQPLTMNQQTSALVTDNSGTQTMQIKPRIRTVKQQPASGTIGIQTGRNTTIKDSEVDGYATGIDGHLSDKLDIEHITVVAPNNGVPIPAAHWEGMTLEPCKNPEGCGPNKYPMFPGGKNTEDPNPPLMTLGGNMVMSGVRFLNPAVDLPQKPVPIGSARSTLSEQEQKQIISSLADKWKKGHEGTPARRLAFIWINEQLKNEGRDFRVEIPKDCSLGPGSPSVGLYIPPGSTTQLQNDRLDGFNAGIVSQGDTTNLSGATVATNCD